MSHSSLKKDTIGDIDTRAVGTIIGKGGDNIKYLQTKYGKECRITYNKQQRQFEIYARNIAICAQVKSALYREETQWKLQRRKTNTQTTIPSKPLSKEWSMKGQEFPEMGGSSSKINSTNAKWGGSLDKVRSITSEKPENGIPFKTKHQQHKNRDKEGKKLHKGSDGLPKTVGNLKDPFWSIDGSSDSGVYA